MQFFSFASSESNPKRTLFLSQEYTNLVFGLDTLFQHLAHTMCPSYVGYICLFTFYSHILVDNAIHMNHKQLPLISTSFHLHSTITITFSLISDTYIRSPKH